MKIPFTSNSDTHPCLKVWDESNLDDELKKLASGKRLEKILSFQRFSNLDTTSVLIFRDLIRSYSDDAIGDIEKALVIANQVNEVIYNPPPQFQTNVVNSKVCSNQPSSIIDQEVVNECFNKWNAVMDKMTRTYFKQLSPDSLSEFSMELIKSSYPLGKILYTTNKGLLQKKTIAKFLDLNAKKGRHTSVSKHVYEVYHGKKSAYGNKNTTTLNFMEMLASILSDLCFPAPDFSDTAMKILRQEMHCFDLIKSYIEDEIAEVEDQFHSFVKQNCYDGLLAVVTDLVCSTDEGKNLFKGTIPESDVIRAFIYRAIEYLQSFEDERLGFFKNEFKMNCFEKLFPDSSHSTASTILHPEGRMNELDIMGRWVECREQAVLETDDNINKNFILLSVPVRFNCSVFGVFMRHHPYKVFACDHFCVSAAVKELSIKCCICNAVARESSTLIQNVVDDAVMYLQIGGVADVLPINIFELFVTKLNSSAQASVMDVDDEDEGDAIQSKTNSKKRKAVPKSKKARGGRKLKSAKKSHWSLVEDEDEDGINDEEYVASAGDI